MWWQHEQLIYIQEILPSDNCDNCSQRLKVSGQLDLETVILVSWSRSYRLGLKCLKTKTASRQCWQPS